LPATVVWFRRDFRVADNPALRAAVSSGNRLIALYIHSPEDDRAWPAGAASRWWLHHSLSALRNQLGDRGIELIIRKGPTIPALQSVVRDTSASEVHWNRLYEPAAVALGRQVTTALRADGVVTRSHNAALLHEPWTVETRSGGPYRAFTPFWRACRALGDPEPPKPLPSLPAAPAPDGLSNLSVHDLDLLPRIRWDRGLKASWRPGEEGAQDRLDAFLQRLAHYPEERDRPASLGTSGLSPHLHFGEIGPRQIWAAIAQRTAEGRTPGLAGAAEKFRAELGWREFAHHLLFANPEMPDKPLDRRFETFPWRDREDGALQAWQDGRTGIPLVDAGMRQLWETGWMHNRVRMVVGSFLVKNLRLPWQLGEAWFWDTLVDADLANNSMGWQWVAGTGADAAPFFRIFNPVRQGERFDPEGEYVARWVPEIAALPAAYRHAPWAAPERLLNGAGVRLDEVYPRPIVDLKESRKEALAGFQKIKAAG
jgi:deoxyribodipyrimidine photo-lyase